MVLDYNCVRDLLIVLEKELVLDEDLSFQFISSKELMKLPELSCYSESQLVYTAMKLEEAGFIVTSERWGDGGIVRFEVEQITYEGHEFLDTVRPKEVWDKTTEKLHTFGNMALNIVQQVATQVAISIALKQL